MVKTQKEILVDCLYCHRTGILGEKELINVPMAIMEIHAELNIIRSCVEENAITTALAQT